MNMNTLCSGVCYLAGLAVHVEGGGDGRCNLSSAALHQVLGEAVGEVGLPCAAGAW